MSEQSEVQKSGETSAPPARGLEEILADPRIAASVAPVRSAILEAREFAGEMTLTVERRRIREVCESFKRDGFTYLVDITAVDYSTYPTPPGDLRFSVVYHLYSFDRKFRVRLKLRVADGVKVPSVAAVWKTANWPERETFDMFGIDFEGHPNMERILTWDGFNGHPLRKDFPLRGIDTGARIYPEVFPAGGGPKEGSTGKNPDDVNIYQEEWKAYGVSPPAGPPLPQKKKAIAPPKPAAPAAEAAPKPAPAAAPTPAAAAAIPAADAEKKRVQMESLEKRMDQIEAQLRQLTSTIDKLVASIAPGAPLAAAPDSGRPQAAPTPPPPAPPPAPAAAPATAAPAAAAAAPPAVPAVTGASDEAPWHNDGLAIDERLALAQGKGLQAELFASMAQTDCGACGWDCEGYAEALNSGETNDVELCVPGDPETMDSLRKLMTAAGKL